MQEILRLIPHEKEHAFCGREAIIRQLHNKGNRIPSENGFANQKCHQNSDKHPCGIQSNHHQCRTLREKCRCKDRINGNLCGAAHKRRKQNRHASVSVRGKGTRCHNGRNGTAKANQKRHNASAGKTDFSQQLVHHKGHAGHVTGILQHGEEEEQHHDDGQKAQHAAHARKDAVNNKAVHNGVDAVDRQCVVGQIGERVNAQCQQVGQACADDTERQPEYQRHNADKAGQGGVFAGQDAVNGHTALVLAAFAGAHNGFVAEAFNKVEKDNQREAQSGHGEPCRKIERRRGICRLHHLKRKAMKRDTIIIEDKAVSVTGNDVWMTATEIAGLFHTTVPAVNAAIRAVRKSDVLNDYEVCRYMQLENRLYADVYALEIIIPVAFRLNTYNTHLFRTWLVRKVLAKEKQQAYVMFIPSGNVGYC